MTGMGSHQDARRLELLADRALDGLSPEEARELDFVLRAGQAGEDESLEATAADVARALVAGRLEPMPTDVADRVRTVLARTADDGRGVAGRIGDAAPGAAAVSIRRTLLRAAGGFAAAAVIVLVALVAMRDRIPPPPADAAEARARLVADAPADLVTMRWKGTDHPRVAEARALGLLSGDVVWSEERGQGFVRVCHLAVNDPAEGSYCVWIWNADDADRRPVAASTFDVTDPDRDTVVELEAAGLIDAPVRASVTLVPAGTRVDRPEPAEELLVALRPRPRQPAAG